MEDVETYDMNVRDAGVLFYAKVIEDYEPPTEVRWMPSCWRWRRSSASVSLPLSVAILFFWRHFWRSVEPRAAHRDMPCPCAFPAAAACSYGPLPPSLPPLLLSLCLSDHRGMLCVCV